MAYVSPDELGADQRSAYANRDALVREALARGVSQAHIDSFLRENPYDYQRLNILAVDTVPLTMLSRPTYATPTPLSGSGSLFAGAGESDSLLVGTVSGLGAAPQTITIDRGATMPALTTQVLPAPGIPTWAIVGAFVLLALLFLRK